MKKKYIILIITMCLISILIVGSSYAYFSATINGNTNSENVVTKTGTLSLSFSDKTPSFNATEISPGWSKTKEVTVENTGSVDVTYDLVWLKLDNEILKDELVYTITCTSGCKGLPESKVPEAGENLGIIKGQTIKSKEIQTYKITFQLKETKENQDYNQGLTIEGTIGIKESGSYEEKDKSIVREGLELLYNKRSLENASDTLIDKSGNRHNGKVEGATKTSEGLSFDGTNDGVIIGELNYDYVTLETEIIIKNFSSTYMCPIANLQSGGYSIRFYKQQVGPFIYVGSYRSFNSASNLATETKYHVVTTYDGKDIKLYIDGNVQATTIHVSDTLTKIGKPGNKTNLALGCNPDGSKCSNEYFNGIISNVKVYSRALSEAEVLKNYNALQ